MANTPVRERQDVQKMWEGYEKKDPTMLTQVENLITAFAAVIEIANSDPQAWNSFFLLGGRHGEPFQNVPANWWGGYCNHGNVLFPSWHRAYMYQFEKALQSIPGCGDVMLPYWDETSPDSKTNGVPQIFSEDNFTYSDGRVIVNPLKSFTFPVDVDVDVTSDTSEPKGSVTVRFPLSGGHDSGATDYNNGFTGPECTTYLNNAFITALANLNYPDKPTTGARANLYNMFAACLKAPNYTVFSNTTSFADYIKSNPGLDVEPLEQPHNDVHLALGDQLFPPQDIFVKATDPSGQIGDPSVAGFDPIFFFHHCNIDRMFWIWQKNHDCYEKSKPFDIIFGNVGAIASTTTRARPVVGQTEGENLTMDTPLNPFINPSTGNVFTTTDIININDLGYDYSPGSFVDVESDNQVLAAAMPARNEKSQKSLIVSEIDRADIKGPFVVNAFMTMDGTRKIVGRFSVFNRTNVKACANCMDHAKISANFPLNDFTEEEIARATFDIEIRGRQKGNVEALGKFNAHAKTDYKPYKLEVL